MSIHICKCTHNGREEYHLRYPGMSQRAAQEIADKINGGALTTAQPAEKPEDQFCDGHCTWRDHHPDCVRAEKPEGNAEQPGSSCIYVGACGCKTPCDVPAENPEGKDEQYSECRHCGFEVRINAAPSKASYPLEQATCNDPLQVHHNTAPELTDALSFAGFLADAVLEYPDFDCDNQDEPRPICKLAQRVKKALLSAHQQEGGGK